ncbi:hypothetical protein [Leisingera aquaemixtae]|uniref:Lipoprotein n=1 Tax=Leisingera aquaemixtae TaxID=1396826 RepID=A0A0P1H7R1_9RHOB|nr:hypothetical protein [Leisingera aquaemixtae]CUH99169.1 hypothetical protein PHA8399_01285 [Leisingera aquaemixtae]
MTVNSKFCVFFVGLCLMACSNDALVYGERTGFNLAIRSDTAESAPVEVNAGIQRRVVSFVPPTKRDSEGNAKGEGVTMISRFDLRRSPGQSGPFSDTVRIRTSFLSGRAATREDVATPDVVAEVVKPPSFALSSDAATSSAQQLLIQYVGSSPSSPSIQTYLNLAEQRGLAVPALPSPSMRALGAITEPANAAANRQIAVDLGLGG